MSSLTEVAEGCAPSTDDHRESFSVNARENYWHCFACEIGSSSIHFYMRWYEVEYQEAMAQLAIMLL